MQGGGLKGLEKKHHFLEIGWGEGKAQEMMVMVTISLKESSFLNSFVNVGVKVS